MKNIKIAKLSVVPLEWIPWSNRNPIGPLAWRDQDIKPNKYLVKNFPSYARKIFCSDAFDALARPTAHDSATYIAQTFREIYREYPRYDKDSNLARLLQHSAWKQQKVIPCYVLREVYKNKCRERSKAVVKLINGFFFFAMIIWLLKSHPVTGKQIHQGGMNPNHIIPQKW